MNTSMLAKEYLERCRKRLEAVKLLLKLKDYADVVRESQEIVELCGKGILRACGMDPPKFHDVGQIVKNLSNDYPDFKRDFETYAKISKKLRKERELSFDGEIDFIPSEEYSLKDAEEALKGAGFSVKLLEKFLRED